MIPFAVFVGSFGLIALLSLVAAGLHRTAEISGEISADNSSYSPVFLEKNGNLCEYDGLKKTGRTGACNTRPALTAAATFKENRVG